MVQTAKLDQRALLSVKGSDAVSFLQGLVTADVASIQNGEAGYSLLLTPQGKLAAEFFIVNRDGDLLLDCAKQDLQELKKRLTMFKLRSNVAIEIESAAQIYVRWGSEDASSLETGLTVVDPRHADLGRRIYTSNEEPKTSATEADYQSFLRSNGVPADLDDIGRNRATALECGFDGMNAISWDKGCFMGQEVTARMRYRGLVKRFTIAHDRALEPDSVLENEDKVISKPVSPWFSSVKVDFLQNNADWQCVDDQGAAVELIKPIWWQASVAVSKLAD